METVDYIMDYFVAPENRYKSDIYLENGKGIELHWSMNNALANLTMYTNYIMTLIKYANKLGIDVVKVAKLIKDGTIQRLGWCNEEEYLFIFLDIMERTNGKNIEETLLAYNAKFLDK